MKDKIFCRFEKKQVNTQYYECFNRFKNCKYCPKLKQSLKIHRSITSRKQNRLGPSREQKQDLFSDWNVYPVHCHWSHDPKSNKLTPDFIVILEDSAILENLIYQFEKEANEGQIKGMEKFWRKAERLSEWKQGNWECLTGEEEEILRAAKDGSIEAIQKLVIANPRLVHLPFVAHVLENLIRTVKFGDRKKLKKTQRLWYGFLPKRVSHKHIVQDEHLRKVLRSIMEVNRCTKEKAVKILLRYDPSFGKEKLRKISVGIGHKALKKLDR